jgi:hypothetical protein
MYSLRSTILGLELRLGTVNGFYACLVMLYCSACLVILYCSEASSKKASLHIDLRLFSYEVVKKVLGGVIH